MITCERLKVLPGLYLGKMCINLSRYTGFGGSTLPGRLAAGISPRLLPILAAQLKEGCILITGTNGKTTTAHLLAHILSQAGKKVIHNRSGANLLPGVTTSFIAESSWLGKIKADLGIIEVDEPSMPAVASQLRVRAVLVTNLFPDQLDRFGEPKQILKLIIKGLQGIRGREGFLLLNADDPLVSSIIIENMQTIYYGIDNITDTLKEVSQTADMKICFRCGKRLAYLHTHFAHLGLYHCLSCGVKRPLPHYSLVSYLRKPNQGKKIVINTPNGLFYVTLNTPGFYNLYNYLAAISCALALGVEMDVIRGSLHHFASCFGRMETLLIEKRIVEIILIKNPAGANEVLRTLAEGEQAMTLMIAVNDRYADGLDISWLWDVDFEKLVSLEKEITGIFCSGTRRKEIALRLKYAGFNTAIMKGEEGLSKTFRDSLDSTPAGGRLQVLVSYTAMLELRKTINKMGHGKKFWEE